MATATIITSDIDMKERRQNYKIEQEICLLPGLECCSVLRRITDTQIGG